MVISEAGYAMMETMEIKGEKKTHLEKSMPYSFTTKLAIPPKRTVVKARTAAQINFGSGAIPELDDRSRVRGAAEEGFCFDDGGGGGLR